jgi:hypothetical protein
MNLEKSQAQNTDSEQGSAEGAASSSDSDTKKIKPSNSSCCSCFTTCCCCSGSGKWSFFTSETKLRTLCLITGILHLFAVAVVSGITDAQERNAIKTPRLKTPITKNIGLWINANETVNGQLKVSGSTTLTGSVRVDLRSGSEFYVRNGVTRIDSVLFVTDNDYVNSSYVGGDIKVNDYLASGFTAHYDGGVSITGSWS